MTQKAIPTAFLKRRLLRHGLSRPRQKEPTRYRVTKAPWFHEAGLGWSHKKSGPKSSLSPFNPSKAPPFTPTHGHPPLDGERGCHIGYPGPQEAMGAYAPSHAIESSIELPISLIALRLWGLIGPMKVSNIQIRRPLLKRSA